MTLYNWGSSSVAFPRGGRKPVKKNIGPTDRLVRFIIAAILIGVALVTKNWIVGVVALFPLLTAIFQYCPAKQAFQFNAT